MGKAQRVRSKGSNVREFPRTAMAVTPITHQEIAECAYDLYVSRGRRDGHDVEDWLAAELRLRQERLQGQEPLTIETGALPS
jgi:hypothetical protein